MPGNQDRLDRLEASLEQILQRLDRLERRHDVEIGRTADFPPARTTIPVQPFQWTAEEDVRVIPPPVIVPTEPTRTTQKTADELEYSLGINGLLRGGAAVMLLGFLLLAAVLIGRGIITPTVQFAGEITGCLALIVLGFVRRNDREDFGQLMTAVGSAGLYASFTGAHAYKHLISAETLVVLAVVLSLLNLAYATVFRSKSFLAMGMLGGLVATLMAGSERSFVTQIALQYVIVAPAAWIGARYRWTKMLMILWVAAAACLLVPLAAVSHGTGAIALYGTTLILALAAGNSTREETDYSQRWLAAFVLMTGGLLTLLFWARPSTALELVGLAVTSVALGWAVIRDTGSRVSLLCGASILVFIVAPMCLDASRTTAIYGIEAAVLAMLAWSHLGRFAWIFSIGTGLFCAVVFYGRDALVGWPPITPAATWTALLCLFLAIALNVIYELHQKQLPKLDVLVYGQSGALVVLLGEMISYTARSRFAPLTLVDSTLLATSIASLSFSIILLRVRKEAFFYFYASLAPIAVMLPVLREPADGQPTVKLAALTMNLAALVISAIQTQGARTSAVVRGFVGLGISLISIRLVESIAYQIGGYDQSKPAAFTAIAAVSIIWAVLGLRTRLRADIALCGVSTVASCVAALSFSPHTLPILVMLLIKLSAIGSLGVFYVLIKQESTTLAKVGIAVCGWIVTADFIALHLLGDLLGIRENATTSMSWVMYALLIMCAGFRLKDRVLRYSSLVVFAITVGRIMMVDLSALDPGIRAAVFLVVGLVMTGAGYGYIVWRSHAGASEEAEGEAH